MYVCMYCLCVCRLCLYCMYVCESASQIVVRERNTFDFLFHKDPFKARDYTCLSCFYSSSPAVYGFIAKLEFDMANTTLKMLPTSVMLFFQKYFPLHFSHIDLLEKTFVHSELPDRAINYLIREPLQSCLLEIFTFGVLGRAGVSQGEVHARGI